MISYEAARSIILESVQALPEVRLKLEQILGSVLAEPVVSNADSPLFDNSAVDGYGLYIADVSGASAQNPVELKVKGELRAGDEPADNLEAGSAYKIYTGAVAPSCLDAVVMREQCEEENGVVKIKYCPRSGENIRRRGDEYLKGQKIIDEGSKATPPVIGLLASLGQASFMVYKKPTVSIISTGSELVKPGHDLRTGQIYDSNSFALKAALEAIGVEEFLPLHCREDLAETRKVLSLALDFADVIITAGGISVGDHDYVKQVFEELGVKTQFYKIAMKPGKPVYFGIAKHQKNGRKQYIFGLPGNPVSALVTFNQLVAPAILKMMGQQKPEQNNQGKGLGQVRARLTKKLKKAAGRLELVRATLSQLNNEFVVQPTLGQDSHMLSGLCSANGLIIFPAEKTLLDENEFVEVEILNWNK